MWQAPTTLWRNGGIACDNFGRKRSTALSPQGLSLGPRVADAIRCSEMRAFCMARIAPFKAPREIEFVDALPRTETGKVQRYKLRER